MKSEPPQPPEQNSDRNPPRAQDGLPEYEPRAVPSRALRTPFLQAFLLVVAVAAGVALDRFLFRFYVPSNAVAEFQLMAQAWNTIQHFYVHHASLNETNMAYGAISGMVDALGDTGHSTFLTPEMLKQVRQNTEGRLKGIGVEVQMRGKHVVVVAPLDDSPAQRAGLRPGDIILRVDGQDITGLPLGQVVKRITGPAGSAVKLTLLEPGTEQTREVQIVREDIQLNPVVWNALPGTRIAHIRIASFAQPLAENLQKALTQIQEQQFTGLILDLRNNPGGILTQAVLTASQFLPGGNVLLVKDARNRVKAIPVQAPGLATNIPMAVLVNRGSASSAEVVAGALKDAQRAPLVGETTFGTGTILNEFTLFDGSALLLAIEEWLTPSGHSIWHQGIKPDIVVPMDPEILPLSPEVERHMTAAQLQSSDDRQLLRALAVLQKDGTNTYTNGITARTRSRSE